jgi:hypothetical protein
LCSRRHRDIRLGLGGVVERDRTLRVDLPVVAERAPKGIQHPPDRRRVPSARWLPHHQQTVDELQALTGLVPIAFLTVPSRTPAVNVQELIRAAGVSIYNLGQRVTEIAHERR